MTLFPPQESSRLSRCRSPETNCVNSAFGNGFGYHYLLGAIASALIAIWAHLAVVAPNPDAVLYLRAAEIFTQGNWQEGLSIYRWPFYSFIIASFMYILSIDALVAAQITNFLLDVGIVSSIITLSRVLSDGDYQLVSIATLFAIFNPQLTQFSSFVVRDHGYLLFFTISVTLCIYDAKRPGIFNKVLLFASIAVSILFRIEGMFLGLCILFYYFLKKSRGAMWRNIVILGFVGVTGVLLPLLFGIWVSGSLTRWLAGDFTASLNIMSDRVATRISALEAYVLFPGSSDGLSAYWGLSIGLAFVGMIRALTVPYAIIGFFAYFPQRYVSMRESVPLFWFSLSQVPMLTLFAFINAFLAWRYAMGFAIIAMFPAIYCIAESLRELRARRFRAFFLFPLFIATVLGTWVADIPPYQRNSHFKDAAEWIKKELPDDARLWMNEPMIAYFAGRDYREVEGVDQLLGYLPPTAIDPASIDYFIYSSTHRIGNSGLADEILSDRKTIARFADKEGNTVVVLQ